MTRLKTRDDYAAYSTADLQHMHRRALDRLTRADTSEAWLTDQFQADETAAALEARGATVPTT